MSSTFTTFFDCAERFYLSRWYWVFLVLLGLCMEAVALYFQYVLLDEPCQICIHIRIWVAAFTLLGVIACCLPQKRTTYIVAHILAVVSMVGLWERCKYLWDVENGRGEGSCQFFLGFPEWFALDAWFPSVFEVRNLCGYTPMMMFGVSMAEALLLLSSLLVPFALLGLFYAWRSVGARSESLT